MNELNDNKVTGTVARDDENKNIITVESNQSNDTSTNPIRQSEMSNSQMTSSSTSASDGDPNEMITSQMDVSLPDWVTVGESVLIRPYNTSGVISFVGPTHFQVRNSQPCSTSSTPFELEPLHTAVRRMDRR